MRPYSFSKPKIRRLRGLGCNMRVRTEYQPALPSSTEGHDPRLRSVWSIWFLWSIWLVSCNQINQTNRTDQMNKLGREELFGVGRRKTTELSAVADAVQDRHLQALQRELLVPDLFECGDTEGESSLEFRGLRQPFLL